MGGGQSGIRARRGSLLLGPGSTPYEAGRWLWASVPTSAEWGEERAVVRGLEWGVAEAHSRTHFSAVGQTAHVLAAGLLPLASSRILFTNKSSDTSVSVFLANHTGSSPYHSLVAQSSEVPCPRSRVPSLTGDP